LETAFDGLNGVIAKEPEGRLKQSVVEKYEAGNFICKNRLLRSLRSAPSQ
jgi:hypothetical protein